MHLVAELRHHYKSYNINKYMYVVFPLIYALAKLQRKNAILVHSPLFFIYGLLSVFSSRQSLLRTLSNSV